MSAVWVLVVAAGLAQPPSQIQFEDVTARSGLRPPLAGIMGHGAAVGDVDGDGRVDLFVGGFCDRPSESYAPAAGPVPTQLLRNLGEGRFAPFDQGVAEMARTSGAVFADLDNDGDLELIVANNAKQTTRRTEEPQRSAQVRRSLLFENVEGRLRDITARSGFCPQDLFTMRNVGVFDYDGDGLLDLLLIEDRFRRGPAHSRLMKNMGQLRFRDVTSAAGLPADLFGLGTAVADVNADGRPDFFVGHSNRFFLSNGDGTYREPESLRTRFRWEPLDGEDWPCGAAFGDLNRDGNLDLVVSIHSQRARNRLYLNEGLRDGVPVFRDVTREAGLPESVATKCPHVEIQDFDNDGWPDIYFSAGWRGDESIEPMIYRHTGAATKVPRFTSAANRDGELVYFPAGPSLDFDDDGRRDLLLVNWFQGNECRLMRNSSPQQNWLKVRALGRHCNRMGIGTRVELYEAGQLGRLAALVATQQIHVGFGYASGQTAECHFGLGQNVAVDARVTFACGRTVELKNVRSNQRIRVDEPR